MTEARAFAWTPLQRLIRILFGPAFLVMAALLAREAMQTNTRAGLWCLISVSAACFGIWFLADLRTKLILEPDRIEIQRAWRTREARRSELSGWREFTSRNGRWVELYRVQGQGSFAIPSGLQGQNELRTWLSAEPNQVPNLDNRDADEVLQRIEQQLGPEATSSHPLLLHANAIQIVLIALLVILAIGSAVAANRQLSSAALWVFLLAPWAALLLLVRYPLLFSAFRPKPDPRVKLEVVLLVPGYFLWQTSASAHTAHLVHAMDLKWWVILAGAVYTSAFLPWALNSAKKTGTALVLLLCALLYGAGAARSANVMADHSTPQQNITIVANKYQTHGKGAANYLQLEPWAQFTSIDKASVSLPLYNKVQAGQPLCVRWHSGLLGAPWYTLVSCRHQP